MKSRNRGWQVFITLLVLAISATVGSAQTTQLSKGSGRLVKQHYRNSGGEKGVTTYLYDHNGLMHRARWELLNGSRHSDNFHTFDVDGNLILKYRKFSEGSTSSVVYEFDDDGNLASESFSRSDGTAGKTTYEYGESGKLEKANCNLLNTWFTGSITYDHDDQGRLAGASILQNSQQIGTIVYGHDEEGNLVKEHWDFGGVWDQTSTYEYEKVKPKLPPSWASTNVFVVDTANYRLVEEHYDFNEKISGTAGFDYDERGRLVGKSYETSQGLRTDTTLEYDDTGLLTRTHRKYSNELTAEFTYRFNGNRRLIRRTFERSDGVTGSERYEYDEKMRLTKAVYENFDSWISGTITFHHADDGGLEKGRFDGERFDADIAFERDGSGNVTRIHWKFDFGKTQTYVLGYEKIPPKPPVETSKDGE